MQDQEVLLFGSIKIGIKVSVSTWKMQDSRLVLPRVIMDYPRPPQYLPTIVIFLATALAAGLNQYEMLPFLYFGAYSAWVYLRFFQFQQESGTQVIAICRIFVTRL